MGEVRATLADPLYPPGPQNKYGTGRKIIPTSSRISARPIKKYAAPSIFRPAAAKSAVSPSSFAVPSIPPATWREGNFRSRLSFHCSHPASNLRRFLLRLATPHLGELRSSSPTSSPLKFELGPPFPAAGGPRTHFLPRADYGRHHHASGHELLLVSCCRRIRVLQARFSSWRLRGP